MGNENSRNASLTNSASKTDSTITNINMCDISTSIINKQENLFGKDPTPNAKDDIDNKVHQEESVETTNFAPHTNLGSVNKDSKSVILVHNNCSSTGTTTDFVDDLTEDACDIMGENAINNRNNVNPEDSSAELVGFLFDRVEQGNMSNNKVQVEKEFFDEEFISGRRISNELTGLQLHDSFNHIVENDYLYSGLLQEGSRQRDENVEDNASCLNGEEGETEESLIFPSNLEYGYGEPGRVHIFSHREIRNGKVIGEGAFGRVLKGSLHGGTPVAIKLFHCPIRVASEQQQNELNKLLTLQHKNVVTILGLIEQTEDIDCTQVVYQYFPEGNILQYLSKHENPEDVQTVGKIVLDVIEGCQFLQECNIVNGNLAARNILIGRVVGRHKTYFNAKITDIGILRFVEPTGGNYLKLAGSNLIVPVRWAPKEIIEKQEDGSTGSEFTFASDVWSLGVTLWEISTRGAMPYGASYSNLRVIQFLKAGYSPLRVHRPSDCPPKIVSVMESIFKVNPDERPSFDRLQESFKMYKGYGRDNKSKPIRSRSVPTPEFNLTAAVEDPVEVENTVEAPTNSSLEEKGAEANLPKKKKNKKKNKFIQSKNGEIEVNTSATPAGFLGVDGVDGAWSLPVSPKPQYQTERPQQQHVQADAQIAALIKRVNQLEKERQGGGRGGGPKPSQWQKRLGPPRFSREGDYSDVRGGVTSRGRMPMPPTTIPPPSSQPPPPYTEEPLPHHSSTRFSKPLPEYEYGHGRGSRGGRGFLPNVPPRHRTGAPNQGSSRGRIEEDFIGKIKRLAEEIEVLRAEKMTQELLKKSAELADIMKVMTTGRTEVSGVAIDSSYARNTGPMGSSPRHADVQGRPYYPNEFNSYDYNDVDDTGRQWSQRETQSSYNFPPPPLSRHHRGNGAMPSRRPYYKGRGNGGNSFRGNGRYNNDHDGDGSYQH